MSFSRDVIRRHAASFNCVLDLDERHIATLAGCRRHAGAEAYHTFFREGSEIKWQ